mmetsp:Transcript_14661/g.35768  ORF Transcript_14661/g.35768 Transcript_14661/m.35768 type:complete len:384 (-) Transcript_14661:1301-2452(-)
MLPLRRGRVFGGGRRRILPRLLSQRRGKSRLFDEAAIASMAKGILEGKRALLSRAITLVESQKHAHEEKAFELFEAVAKERAGQWPTPRFRVGITGPPGAGKSTFIAALGMHLIRKGHKLSVLAIDPSSTRTGGSILGDKTRMHDLSLEQNAFIRPSPSGGHLGGIAQATAESAALCEAAGYSTCLIETVGVGQSETAVSEMVDMVLLLMPPAAGDDLQGMKKGIVELADLIVVNKADGELIPKARHAQTDYQHALQLLRPKYTFWDPPVLMCSSIPASQGAGVDPSIEKVWDTVEDFRRKYESTGTVTEVRKTQREQMMWREVQHQVLSLVEFCNDENLASEIEQVRESLMNNSIVPRHAARRILKILLTADLDSFDSHVDV